MPHYERNVRFILFLILPILGFLLGWSLSQKNTHTPAPAVEVKIDANQEELAQLLEEKPRRPLFRRLTEPKDVDLSILWESWNVLEANFLYKDDFDIQSQVYGATKGIVDSLDDPYTVFMTPEETSSFEESISGEFEGIGAEIAIRDNKLTIISPLKGSPAELAGLRAGDIVYQIDTEPTYGITIEEAVTQIRGPKGEKVVLTVLREGERKPVDVTIVRDTIVIESVEWKMEEGLAVVSIAQFGTEAESAFLEILPEIIQQRPEGMIIDLRNNGGGLLDVCLAIADEFFSDQIVVKTSGRRFGDTGSIRVDSGGAFLEVPVVVLVNKGSASASEIFAGAVQDHNRGILLGEKTFGKGSVQNVIPLSDGSSLKVTIAEWHTPTGRSIHEEGITPDEDIEMVFEDLEEGKDPVMDRAVELLTSEEYETVLAAKKAQSEVDDIAEQESIDEEILILEAVEEEETFVIPEEGDPTEE